MALGHVGLAGLDLLAGDLAGELLQADRAIAVHQHDQWLRLLVLHHQGLDDLVLGHAELLGGLAGAAVIDVVVDVLAERDLVLAQHLRGQRLADMGGFLAHAAIVRAGRGGGLYELAARAARAPRGLPPPDTPWRRPRYPAAHFVFTEPP